MLHDPARDPQEYIDLYRYLDEPVASVWRRNWLITECQPSDPQPVPTADNIVDIDWEDMGYGIHTAEKAQIFSILRGLIHPEYLPQERQRRWDTKDWAPVVAAALAIGLALERLEAYEPNFFYQGRIQGARNLQGPITLVTVVRSILNDDPELRRGLRSIPPYPPGAAPYPTWGAQASEWPEVQAIIDRATNDLLQTATNTQSRLRNAYYVTLDALYIWWFLELGYIGYPQEQEEVETSSIFIQEWWDLIQCRFAYANVQRSIQEYRT